MPNFLTNTIENLAAALGLAPAPDDWRSRLRETITITAPDGTVFDAKWTGNAHTITGKLGIHTFPGISGARVQGLGTGEEIYDLAILFGGENNDLNAAAFMESYKKSLALDEDWNIDHPTKGPLFGKFISITENDFPIESGNLTVIQCPFIINLPETAEESAAQFQAQAEFQASRTNETASDQFDFVAKLETPGQIQAVISGVTKAMTAANKALSLVDSITIFNPELITTIQSVRTAIENTLNGDIIDLSNLAGQCQTFVQLFGLGQDDATDAIKMFSDFSTILVEDQPEQATSEGVSTAAVTEMFATATLVAAAQSALIGGIRSRAQAVITVELLNLMFENVTAGLDQMQLLYADNLINNKYFSQSSTYADVLILISDASRFLLTSLFSLPAERTVILKEDTGLYQIAMNEYGTIGNPGDPDPELEMLNVLKIIAGNDLHGDDTYLLRAGSRVLIYDG